MKIDTSRMNPATIGQDVRTDLKRARTAATEAPAGEDSATGLSASASTMAARLQATPAIRTEKVAALQQAVASGQYQVDAGAVASSMMRELA